MGQSCTVEYVGEGAEDGYFPGDLDYDEVTEAAANLFSKAKIRIPSYEELHYACISENGDVLGAATSGYTDHTEYNDEGMQVLTARFSIVVSSKSRRQGIARELVKAIVDYYERDGLYNESYVILEAEVVNPDMARLLKSEGFANEDGFEWSREDPYMQKMLG
jgi:ribosomal protein S18 acetylase RimI-like enzyme